MERLDKVQLTRRDMLRLSIGGAGMFALTASGLAVPSGLAKGGGGSGNIYLEAFPTSPLILTPFNDPLTVPKALRPVPKTDVDAWSSPPGQDNQDFVKGTTANKHQLWPGQGVTASYPWTTTTPDVYQIKLEVNGHNFTSSMVQPIDSHGRNVIPPGSGSSQPRKLPAATIYGFNGTFPGPMINAQYGRPALVRFENPLEEDNGFDRDRLRGSELLVPDPPAQRPYGVGVGRQPVPRLPALQPARAPGPRGRLRARRVGRQPLHGVPRGWRRPREAVVLLVPRPRPRPHRRQRLQGHGRPHAAL